MEQNAAHVSRVISSVPSNAAESARPLSGSAQHDTKLYTPTDGRSVGFVDAVDAVDVVDAVVLVVEVEVEDWEEAAADEEEEVLEGIEEEVLEDMEEGVLEVIEEEVLEDVKKEVLKGKEDEVEVEDKATEVVVVAEEFDDISW